MFGASTLKGRGALEAQMTITWRDNDIGERHGDCAVLEEISDTCSVRFLFFNIFELNVIGSRISWRNLSIFWNKLDLERNMRGGGAERVNHL